MSDIQIDIGRLFFLNFLLKSAAVFCLLLSLEVCRYLTLRDNLCFLGVDTYKLLRTGAPFVDCFA